MKREVRYFAQDGENIFYLCVHCKYFSADCAHIHCSTQTHTLIQTSFPTFPKTDYQWNLSQPSLRRSWIPIGRSLAKMNELSRQSKYLFSLWGGDLDLEISWPAPLPRSRCCWSQRRETRLDKLNVGPDISKVAASRQPQQPGQNMIKCFLTPRNYVTDILAPPQHFYKIPTLPSTSNDV